MDWVLFIVGPTASGKSDWAVALAEQWHGVVINCDSRQFYRDVPIGTAWPSPEAMQRVPHLLYGWLHPEERPSVGEFIRRARAAVLNAWARGRLPILVGGSGLYYRGFRFGLHPPPAADPTVRSELEMRAREEGLSALYTELQQVDPQSAARIHPHDARRIIRALEIYHTTGRPASVWRTGWRHPVWPSVAIGLMPPWSYLRNRIRERNRVMWQSGWLDEVVSLLDAGIDLSAPVFESIGYRTIAEWWMRGRSVPETALLAEIDRATWRLARRQMQWFRRERDVIWWTAPPTIAEVTAWVRARLRRISRGMTR